jgi:rare lipoprotein A (peptidoglycan hydrolase)
LVLIGVFGVLWAAGLAYVIAKSGSDSPASRERKARTVAGLPAANAAIADDPEAYRPLPKSRPTLVEPEAGVPSAVETETTQPKAGADTVRPQSDAEIRAELRQLKSYYASVSTQFDLGAASAPYELTAGQISNLSGWQTSVASVYFDYGGPLACGGRLRRDQFGVANKNLPCGTMVTFRYGGRALRVPVIDRGPYIRGREWDLTGATAIALNFNGLGPIDWIIG